MDKDRSKAILHAFMERISMETPCGSPRLMCVLYQAYHILANLRYCRRGGKKWYQSNITAIASTRASSLVQESTRMKTQENMTRYTMASLTLAVVSPPKRSSLTSSVELIERETTNQRGHLRVLKHTVDDLSDQMRRWNLIIKRIPETAASFPHRWGTMA